MPKRVKKHAAPKRDENEIAFDVVQQVIAASGEPTDAFQAQLSAYMARLGAKGGKISGAKRMQNLTDAKRSEVALKAATARWDKERAKKR